MIFGQNFDQFFDQVFDRVFDEIFDQIFGQGFDQGLGVTKYSLQYYWDRKYSSTGTGENTIYYVLFEIQKIQKPILGTI